MKSVDQNQTPADTSRIVARWGFREFIGLVMMGAILFVSAGRLDWGWGWAVLVVMAVWVMATAAVTVTRYPQLLAERVRPVKGAKAWDTALLGVAGILMLGGLLIAGLDARNGWTAGFPVSAQIIAVLGMMAGHALTVWAIASNPFFSQVVRIQSERGHTVATGGPYRFVRHPSNLGQIVFYLAVPIALGSWPAALFGIACALLILLRTVLEDRTLMAELAGYKEYAAKVRYRLLPSIW